VTFDAANHYLTEVNVQARSGSLLYHAESSDAGSVNAIVVRYNHDAEAQVKAN